MITKEIRIPVPWGYVIAQVWGSEVNQKVLMLHGLGDNSESFSGIVPLLPKTYCYIALDLPGHGKSSHLSKHIMAQYMDHVIMLRIVIRYLKESPIILLSHSYGGLISTFYAQLYPNEISRLIIIEPSYLPYQTVRNFKNSFKTFIEQVCASLIQNVNPRYIKFTYEEGLSNFCNKRWYGGMTKEIAENLFKRAIKKIDQYKYQTQTDPLLKYIRFQFINGSASHNILEKLPIQCPILHIVGLDSKLPKESSDVLLKIVKINSKRKTNFLKGDHYLICEAPDTVAKLISDFLMQKCHL